MLTLDYTFLFFRYLAKGYTFTDLHENFKLGISTIAEIIRCTCKVIWNELSQECLPELTEQRLKEIAREYESKANFPSLHWRHGW